jgi:hypothetical protein
MTSNSGIDFMPNSMLHNRLFKPIVACNLETLNFGYQYWDGLMMSTA